MHPSGIRNCAGDCLAVAKALGQAREFSFGFRAGQRSRRIDDRDSGAVVASILQPPQRVKNDRDAVAGSNVPDDPAHYLNVLRTSRGPHCRCAIT